MRLQSKSAVRNGVSIHYLDSVPDADPTLVPLLLCPGLSETAEEYRDLIEYVQPRRAIALSFRGRGQSDTPETGYDLKDHVADVEAVVEHAGLRRFNLYGYSRGVSYALEYTRLHPERVERLLVLDYPPEHKAMPPEWAADYIENYLIPFNRLKNIRPEAVRGIQRESAQQDIAFDFDRSVLAMRGMLDGALMSDADAERYGRQFSNIRIEAFQNSGHDVRHTEQAKLYGMIQAFLRADE